MAAHAFQKVEQACSKPSLIKYSNWLVAFDTDQLTCVPLFNLLIFFRFAIQNFNFQLLARKKSLIITVFVLYHDF